MLNDPTPLAYLKSEDRADDGGDVLAAIEAAVEKRMAEFLAGTFSESDDGHLTWTAPLSRWITGTVVADIADARLRGGA